MKEGEMGKRLEDRSVPYFHYYSVAEARAAGCSRCGGPWEPAPGAPTQVLGWNTGCATRNRNIVLCIECDIEANRLLMEFLGITGIPQRLAWYRRKLFTPRKPAALGVSKDEQEG